ncbi:MAG: MFS transporter [Acidimicrobiales bacterium]
MTGAGRTARLGTVGGRWIVGGMVLGSAATFVNTTVVNVALPAIGEDLDAGLVGLQWVTNAYLLTLASLLLAAGSAGDIYGRRRVYLVGCALFGAGLLVSAAAPSLPVLIAGRLLLGVGGAAMTPISLAIVDGSFAEEERSAAIGAWASGSALASAAGPFIGGVLVDRAGWRWVFLISLPLLAGSMWATWRHVPGDDGTGPGPGGDRSRRLDIVGAVAACLAVVGSVYALTQSRQDGWLSPAVMSALAVGAGAAVAFVINERRHDDPMVPFRLFGERQFSGTNAMTLLLYFSLGGAFFFTAVAFQTVVGYSAAAAGAALLPANVVMIVGSPQVGKLSARYGPRWLVTGGSALAAVGFALLARVDESASYATDILPAALVLGAGLALFVPPLTSAVLASVGDADVGIGSAVNNAVARTGGLLATATLPALVGAAEATGGPAFAAGYQRALASCAALCLAAAVVGATTVGRRVTTHTDQAPSMVAGCSQRSLPASPHR